MSAHETEYVRMPEIRLCHQCGRKINTDREKMYSQPRKDGSLNYLGPVICETCFQDYVKDLWLRTGIR